jgi:hypothetical protein
MADMVSGMPLDSSIHMPTRFFLPDAFLDDGPRAIRENMPSETIDPFFLA